MGKIKGKIHVYVKTPTGEKLRSNKEIKIYCKEQKIINENVPEVMLSPSNSFQGHIKLERYSESLSNSENEEDYQEILLTEVFQDLQKQDRQLSKSQRWIEAMDK